jgi:hypothetical protein
MNSITTRKTANQAIQLIPSTFGMPFGMSTCGHTADVARIKGDMGLAVRAYVAPGSAAWSPPTS